MKIYFYLLLAVSTFFSCAKTKTEFIEVEVDRNIAGRKLQALQETIEFS